MKMKKYYAVCALLFATTCFSGCTLGSSDVSSQGSSSEDEASINGPPVSERSISTLSNVYYALENSKNEPPASFPR